MVCFRLTVHGLISLTYYYLCALTIFAFRKIRLLFVTFVVSINRIIRTNRIYTLNFTRIRQRNWILVSRKFQFRVIEFHNKIDLLVFTFKHSIFNYNKKLGVFNRFWSWIFFFYPSQKYLNFSNYLLINNLRPALCR